MLCLASFPCIATCLVFKEPKRKKIFLSRNITVSQIYITIQYHMSSFENISFYVFLKCTNCICLTKFIKMFLILSIYLFHIFINDFSHFKTSSLKVKFGKINGLSQNNRAKLFSGTSISVIICKSQKFCMKFFCLQNHYNG